MNLKCLALACLSTIVGVSAQLPGGPFGPGGFGGPGGPGLGGGIPLGAGAGLGGAGLGQAGLGALQQQQAAAAQYGQGAGVNPYANALSPVSANVQQALQQMGFGGVSPIVNAGMQMAGTGIGTFQQGMGQLGVGQAQSFQQQYGGAAGLQAQQLAALGGGGYSYGAPNAAGLQQIGNVGNFAQGAQGGASPFFIQAVGDDQQLGFQQVQPNGAAMTWMPDYSQIRNIPVGLGGMAGAQLQAQAQQAQQPVLPLGSNSPPIGSVAWMQANLTPGVVSTAINWAPNGQNVGPQVMQGPAQLQAQQQAAFVQQQPQQMQQPQIQQPQLQQQAVQLPQIPVAARQQQAQVQPQQPQQAQVAPALAAAGVQAINPSSDVFQQIAHPAQLTSQQLQQLINAQMAQLGMNTQQAQAQYMQQQAQQQAEAQAQLQQQAMQQLQPMPVSPQALVAANLNHLGAVVPVGQQQGQGQAQIQTQGPATGFTTQAVGSGGLPWGMPAFGASRGLPQQHTGSLPNAVVMASGGNQPAAPAIPTQQPQPNRLASIPPSAVQPIVPGRPRPSL